MYVAKWENSQAQQGDNLEKGILTGMILLIWKKPGLYMYNNHNSCRLRNCGLL